MRYLLYAQAVLQLSFGDQIYSRVQGPLVLAGKDDVGSIEPGHLGDFVINVAPAGNKRRQSSEVMKKQAVEILKEKMQLLKMR